MRRHLSRARACFFLLSGSSGTCHIQSRLSREGVRHRFQWNDLDGHTSRSGVEAYLAATHRLNLAVGREVIA